MPTMTAAAFRSRANEMVGLPYVLGAEWSPSCTGTCRPRALDCSELIEGLYRENSTPIGDLAAAQYDKTVAASGSPKVGDLVFLRNNPARWNRIGHVAVITAKLANGDYEIIEARGRKYGVVRTTLSYWKTRAGYTGVRRFNRFALLPSSPVPPLSITPGKLAVDGQYGPLTSAAVASQCATGAGTKALQSWLNGRGWRPVLKVDGERGPKTNAAIAWAKSSRMRTRALQAWLNGASL